MPHQPKITKVSPTNQQLPARPTPHQVAWVAAGIRMAAREGGVDMPVDYVRRITTDGLMQKNRLGVSRLGSGVVIHTAAERLDRIPVVLGHADSGGQWLRDGRRYHVTVVDTAPEPPAEAVNR
jgi:glycosyltransferase A (GT-A) superfamily protein (DUF2064 family)